MVDEQRLPKLVVVLLDPSISLKKKCEASRRKYLLDKVQWKGQTRFGETFRIFSFLAFGFGGQADSKLNGRWGNVRFSMKKKEQYSGIAF